jgi:mannose-6-phosphate isomerase-like protein (cupin superfamily)
VVRSYLDGGLTVETLAADAAAGRFRAQDARGDVAWLARGEPFGYLHAISFSGAGVRRGFHLHAGHRERLYVVSGTLRLLASWNGERIEVALEPGSLATFAPGVAHGLVAQSAALAVSFGDGSDPIADTVPCPDLG